MIYQGPNYYRTRDGHKALVGDAGDFLTGCILQRLEGFPVAWHWRRDGRSQEGQENGSDLIALWAE